MLTARRPIFLIGSILHEVSTHATRLFAVPSPPSRRPEGWEGLEGGHLPDLPGGRKVGKGFWAWVGSGKRGVLIRCEASNGGLCCPCGGVPPAEGWVIGGVCGLLEWGFCLAEGKNRASGRAYRPSSASVSVNSDQSIGGDGGEAGIGAGLVFARLHKPHLYLCRE